MTLRGNTTEAFGFGEVDVAETGRDADAARRTLAMRIAHRNRLRAERLARLRAGADAGGRETRAPDSAALPGAAAPDAADPAAPPAEDGPERPAPQARSEPAPSPVPSPAPARAAAPGAMASTPPETVTPETVNPETVTPETVTSEAVVSERAAPENVVPAPVVPGPAALPARFPTAAASGAAAGEDASAALEEFLRALTQGAGGRVSVASPPAAAPAEQVQPEPAAVLRFQRPAASESPAAAAAPGLSEPRAAPICDLDRLDGAGPGLIWALNRAGIACLAELAPLEAPDLAARLGYLGPLVPAEAWIAAARNR